MATENVKLKVEVETGQAAKSLTDLKKEFKTLQQELNNTKVGTKEYVDVLKRLGETKDDIGDLQQNIKALGSNAEKFKAVGNVVQGIAGGFAAASGAAALFGGEAEEVQKAMLKVQAALALQQGISAILELGDAFKVLKTIILTNPIFILATILATVIGYFVGLENIIKGVKAGFKALGDAVSAAFEFIVDGVMYAIDLYTQYLDLVTFGLFDLNGAYKGYVESIEKANEAERKRIEALKAEEKLLKEQIKSLNDQVEAIEKAQAAIDEKTAIVVKSYEREIELANAAGANTEQLEKDKLEFVRAGLEEKIALQIKAFELQQQIAEKELQLSQNQFEQGNNFYAASLKLNAQKKVESQKTTLETFKTQLDDINHQINLDEAKRNKESADAFQKLQDEKKRAAEETAKFMKDLSKQTAEDNKKEQEEFVKSQATFNDILKEQRAQQTAEALALAETNKQIAEQQAINDEAGRKRDAEFEKQAAEQRVSLALGTFQTLAGLTDLFGKKNEENAKKAFEINKALNIASALVQTYQSATGAYASQISIPTPDAPIRAAIAAGIAIAAGLGNVARIAATKFDTKSASGGGGGGASAPSVNAPSSTGNNSIDTTLLNRQAIEQGNQPTQNRVVVVETDISSTQRRVAGIRNRATVVE